MLRLIMKCAFCKKETMAYEDNSGILFIDFEKKLIHYFCESCQKPNDLNLGEIQTLLEKKTSLPFPRIGGVRS